MNIITYNDLTIPKIVPIIWLGLLLMMGAKNKLYAQKIIDLEDYGVVPDSFGNASPALAKALADAKGHDSTLIRFPGGRIDLWPLGAETREYYISNTTEADTLSKVKTIGILLENLSNVHLQGNGTQVISHGKMVHLAIDGCKNISVQGLSFDYERPTMSELEILDMEEDFIVARINAASRYTIDGGKIIWYGEGWRAKKNHVIIYRPATETMYYEPWGPFAAGRAVDIGLHRVKFTGDFSKSKIRKGDFLSSRDTYRDCVGILNQYSQQVSFTDLKLNYMHGLGIVSQFSKDIAIDRIIGRPRAETGRKIAAFADFLHFSGCYGKIRIENSLFSGSHDDCVNIHGTYLRVVAHKGNTVKVRFMHQQTWNIAAFEKGDSIGFVNNDNLMVYDRAVVKNVRKISKRELELQLDRPVPKNLKEDHCIENISKTPEVVIRKNRFEHTNTRGLLLTTRRKILVEDNVFYRTGMHAILIESDCNFWYESGPVKDVTIRNNTFLECGYNSFPNTYPIAIKPEIHSFIKGDYVHADIKILDNDFTLFNAPLLWARSTDGLTFSGNTINASKEKTFPIGDKPMFFLEQCNTIKIHENKFSTHLFKKEIKVSDMKRNQLNYSPKEEFHLVQK